jgi:hypothetical protein
VLRIVNQSFAHGVVMDVVGLLVKHLFGGNCYGMEFILPQFPPDVTLAVFCASTEDSYGEFVTSPFQNVADLSARVPFHVSDHGVEMSIPWSKPVGGGCPPIQESSAGRVGTSEVPTMAWICVGMIT